MQLDDLFNVEATVTLPGGEAIIVRTLTDAEIQMRDKASITAAAAVEAKLLDKESDEHKEMIEPLQQLGRDDLIIIIMAVADVTTRAEVEREYPYRYVPLPDDASEEEKREVTRRQEESEARVLHLRSEEVSTRLTDIANKLSELDEDKLRSRAVNAAMQSSIFNAKYEEFIVQTVYMSARIGSGKGRNRFDLEHVKGHGKKDGLNENVFRYLLQVYGTVDTADPWELQKKL